MSIRIDGTADLLQRTANLPSLTAFTLCGWSRVISNLGATLQPLFWCLDAGATDGILFHWDDATGNMDVEVSDGGAITASVDLGSRPAVGTDFFWYIKCSGTGANLLEAGWRAAGSNTFVTGTTTLGTTIAAPATFFLGGVLSTYYSDHRLWNAKCWNRALSQAELEWEGRFQRVVFPSSLNWHWWLRNANDTVDRGPNARNATTGGTLTTEDEYPLWVPRPLALPRRRSTQSFSYSASGGLSLAGSASRAAVRAVSAAGGLTLSGASATVRKISRTAAGGLSIAGAASFAKGQTVAPAGGLNLSGNAAQLRTRVLLPAGGIVLGGSAGFSSSGTQQLVVTPSGGLVLGGAAATSRSRALAATGGFQLGGASAVATHEAVRTVTPSGGLQFGGSASVSTVTAGGSTSEGIQRARKRWPR